MADTKTALLLVMLTGCALCWENLPTIPAGRRAEYYLLHDDGAYKHGYDTGEGQAASAKADARNQVHGQWQYVNDEGQKVSWAYTAGDVGYVPVLVSHIGGAEFKSGGSHGSGQQIAGSAAHTSSSGQASSALSPSAHGSGSTSSSSIAHDASAHGSSGGHEVHDDNADASYKFNIDTSSYTRDEQADSRGNIQGRYSYNSPVGGSHAVSYTAGAGKGFVVTSSTSDDAAPRDAAPVVPWTGPLADIKSVINADGSYSYSYNNGDSEHQVSGDAQNNVRGSYASTSGGKINYHAGSGTGYVASGDAVPAVTASQGAWSANSAASQGGWSSNSAASQGGWSANSAASQGGWSAGKDAWAGESHDSGEDSGDASYNYSYETDSSSKQESADAAGNVVGSFTYLGGDGVSRKLTYTANPAQGFVASGDHLPVAPAIAPAWAAPPIAAVRAPVAWSAPPAPVQRTSPPHPGGSADVKNDGSYSYSYSTDTQSVQQSADADNNVKGSYSFKAKDDGQTRTVNWQAGSATGFVAEGAHLPVADAGHAAAKAAHGSSQWSASQSGDAGLSQSSHGDESGDKSYSYSYKTDSSSKDETSDASGNVMGTFTYLGGDGVARKLTYTANPAHGFVASGAHLPVAPTVGDVATAHHGASHSAHGDVATAHAAHGASHSAHGDVATSHAAHAHGLTTNDGNIVVSRYLPPASQHKYGYIFDTKA